MLHVQGKQTARYKCALAPQTDMAAENKRVLVTDSYAMMIISAASFLSEIKSTLWSIQENPTVCQGDFGNNLNIFCKSGIHSQNRPARIAPTS